MASMVFLSFILPIFAITALGHGCAPQCLCSYCCSPPCGCAPATVTTTAWIEPSHRSIWYPPSQHRRSVITETVTATIPAMGEPLYRNSHIATTVTVAAPRPTFVRYPSNEQLHYMAGPEVALQDDYSWQDRDSAARTAQSARITKVPTEGWQQDPEEDWERGVGYDYDWGKQPVEQWRRELDDGWKHGLEEDWPQQREGSFETESELDWRQDLSDNAMQGSAEDPDYGVDRKQGMEEHGHQISVETSTSDAEYTAAGDRSVLDRSCVQDSPTRLVSSFVSRFHALHVSRWVAAITAFAPFDAIDFSISTLAPSKSIGFPLLIVLLITFISLSTSWATLLRKSMSSKREKNRAWHSSADSKGDVASAPNDLGNIQHSPSLMDPLHSVDMATSVPLALSPVSVPSDSNIATPAPSRPSVPEDLTSLEPLALAESPAKHETVFHPASPSASHPSNIQPSPSLMDPLHSADAATSVPLPIGPVLLPSDRSNVALAPSHSAIPEDAVPLEPTALAGFPPKHEMLFHPVSPPASDNELPDAAFPTATLSKDSVELPSYHTISTLSVLHTEKKFVEEEGNILLVDLDAVGNARGRVIKPSYTSSSSVSSQEDITSLRENLPYTTDGRPSATVIWDGHTLDNPAVHHDGDIQRALPIPPQSESLERNPGEEILDAALSTPLLVDDNVVEDYEWLKGSYPASLPQSDKDISVAEDEEETLASSSSSTLHAEDLDGGHPGKRDPEPAVFTFLHDSGESLRTGSPYTGSQAEMVMDAELLTVDRSHKREAEEETVLPFLVNEGHDNVVNADSAVDTQVSIYSDATDEQFPFTLSRVSSPDDSSTAVTTQNLRIHRVVELQEHDSHTFTRTGFLSASPPSRSQAALPLEELAPLNQETALSAMKFVELGSLEGSSHTLDIPGWSSGHDMDGLLGAPTLQDAVEASPAPRSRQVPDDVSARDYNERTEMKGGPRDEVLVLSSRRGAVLAESEPVSMSGTVPPLAPPAIAASILTAKSAGKRAAHNSGHSVSVFARSLDHVTHETAERDVSDVADFLSPSDGHGGEHDTASDPYPSASDSSLVDGTSATALEEALACSTRSLPLP